MDSMCTWEDQESDLGAPDVDVLELSHPAVPVGDRDGRHLGVHVVLSLNQLATVDLTNVWLIFGWLVLPYKSKVIL